MSCRAGRHIAMLPSLDTLGDALLYSADTTFRISVPDGYVFSIAGADIVPGFSLAIDWGDGAVSVVTKSWPADGVPAPSHVYTRGIYVVRLPNVITSLSVSPLSFTASVDASSPVTEILTVGSLLKAIGFSGFSYSTGLARPDVLAGSNISRFLSTSAGDQSAGPFYGAELITGDAAWLPRRLVGKFPENGLARSGLTSLAGFPCEELLPGFVDLCAVASFPTAVAHPRQAARLIYSPGDRVWTLTFAEGVLEDFVRKRFFADALPGTEITGFLDQWVYDARGSTDLEPPAGFTSCVRFRMNCACELHITDHPTPVDSREYYRQLVIRLEVELLDGVLTALDGAYPVHVFVTFGTSDLTLSPAELDPVSNWSAYMGSDDSTPDRAVVDIGRGAFEQCENLTSIDSTFKYIRDIGDDAFRYCTSLGPCYPEKQMQLAYPLDAAGRPGGRRVGERAFMGCTSLEYVMREPDGSVWFELRAFDGCTGITTLDGLSLAGYALCATLSRDGAAVTSRAPVAFDTAHHPPNPTVSRSGNTATVTVPDGRTLSYTWPARDGTVTSVMVVPVFSTSLAPGAYLGPYCFAGCTGLTSTRGLPFSIRDYPEGLFYGCTGLTEYIDVTDPGATGDFVLASPVQPDFVPRSGGRYPNSCFTTGNGASSLLKTIGDSCFADCTSLSTVEFTGVTSVGAFAFSGCTSLRRIDFLPYTIPLYSNGVQQSLSAVSSMVSVGARFLEDCSHSGATPAWETGLGAPYMHELVIRFDSEVMPTFDPEAFTYARRHVSGYTGGVAVQQPWLVLQFRSLTLADGSEFSGDLKDYASDSITKNLIRSQVYQTLSEPLHPSLATYNLSLLQIGLAGFLKGASVTVGFHEINESGVYAPPGTVFKVPVYLVGEYWAAVSSSKRTLVDSVTKFCGYVDAELTGWTWTYQDETTFVSYGFTRPTLTFTSGIYGSWMNYGLGTRTFELSNGATAVVSPTVYACISTLPCYESAVMRQSEVLASADATEHGDLRGKEFVFDLVRSTRYGTLHTGSDGNLVDGNGEIVDLTYGADGDIAYGVDIPDIPLKLSATSYQETAEDGTTTTVQVPESTVMVTVERVGSKLVVDSNHNPGEYVPVVKIKTSVPYKKGQSVVAVGWTLANPGGGSIHVPSPVNLQAEFWPMTPNTQELYRNRYGLTWSTDPDDY